MTERLSKIEELTNQLRESKQQLTVSGQKYKALADATFESIFITIEDVIINMNKSACELFICCEEDYVGRSVLDVIYKDDKELLKNYLRSNYEGKIELRAVKSEIEMIDIELQSKVTCIENSKEDVNKIYIHTIAIRDITERRYSDIKLQNAIKKYKNLFENALVGIFQISCETGEVLECNKKTLDIFGYTDKEEFKKETKKILDITLDGKPFYYFADKVIKENEVDSRMKFNKKDGSEFWADIRAKVFNVEGHMEGSFIEVTIPEIKNRRMDDRN